VSKLPFTRQPLSVWVRLAAFFSFLALLSALVAPASMLAEEVRTGQLGGVCHVSPNPDGDGAIGSGNAPQADAHCELCCALGWALPPLAVAAIPCFAGHQVAAANFPAAFAVTIAGLPFSRGPPALLS